MKSAVVLLVFALGLGAGWLGGHYTKPKSPLAACILAHIKPGMSSEMIDLVSYACQQQFPSRTGADTLARSLHPTP